MKHNYENLKIYQRSFDLALKVYEIVLKFPRYEDYGLSSQIRRSAVSIFSNIAEGAARNINKDFKSFLSISVGSLCELESQLVFSSKLSYSTKDQITPLLDELVEIRKMILSYKNKIHEK